MCINKAISRYFAVTRGRTTESTKLFTTNNGSAIKNYLVQMKKITWSHRFKRWCGIRRQKIMTKMHSKIEHWIILHFWLCKWQFALEVKLINDNCDSNPMLCDNLKTTRVVHEMSIIKPILICMHLLTSQSGLSVGFLWYLHSCLRSPS